MWVIFFVFIFNLFDYKYYCLSQSPEDRCIEDYALEVLERGEGKAFWKKEEGKAQCIFVALFNPSVPQEK